MASIRNTHLHRDSTDYPTRHPIINHSPGYKTVAVITRWHLYGYRSSGTQVADVDLDLRMRHPPTIYVFARASTILAYRSPRLLHLISIYGALLYIMAAPHSRLHLHRTVQITGHFPNASGLGGWRPPPSFHLAFLCACCCLLFSFFPHTFWYRQSAGFLLEFARE
jgi:hypothetical protein